MAKQSGVGSYLFVGTADLSGDVGSVQTIETSRAVQDVTSITSAAMERIVLRHDGQIAFNSFWNTSVGQAHATLSAVPRTDVLVSAFIGATVGGPAASMYAKQTNYPLTLGADGSLLASIAATGSGAGSNYGLEWGEMLTTGPQSFATGTVNGTSIDLGAVSTLFGAAAYIHILTMPSGTATFAIQDSADNVTFANVTGMSFTAATGPTTERKQGATNATVRRYVRLQGTGVHGTALVACNFIRYLTDPSL